MPSISAVSEHLLITCLVMASAGPVLEQDPSVLACVYVPWSSQPPCEWESISRVLQMDRIAEAQ